MEEDLELFASKGERFFVLYESAEQAQKVLNLNKESFTLGGK
jgi:hypothetical protein